MVDIDVKVSGDITEGLDKFERKIKQRVIFSGVAAMAKVIYDEVKLNTSGARAIKRPENFEGPMPQSPPGRVTGNLHNAVYRAYSPEKSTDATKTYHVSVNKKKAPHWWWLEYGSSRIPAHPYLRPALSRMSAAGKAGMAAMKNRMNES